MSGPALTLLDGVRWRGVPVPGERSQALLAALALAAGRSVTDGLLVDRVWGAHEQPANPTKALQVLVSRTRAQTAAELVVRTDRGYRLGAPAHEVDSSELAARVVSARAAAAAGEPARARDEAQWAVALAIGTAAAEGPLEEVRRVAREQVDEARRILGTSLSDLGQHAEALELLEPSFGEDDETALAALLRSEASVRGAAAALERYEGYRASLAERLGTDPGPALQQLHAELLARDHPIREGLLYDASRLIGRDADVAALAETIRTSRVTSIVGPGGLGKTRLAHLMGRLAEQPAVHFVELAGVTSPDGVAVEVGDVLGVRESVAARLTVAARRTDLVSRIVDQVGTAPALLVLDNCEHLIDAVADLVQVLVTRTPALRVLTTSRAPLGIAAERVYQLPQLGLADAAELFVERASAARPGARLEPVEVGSLVARLDGLPLAVELAAAKVRVMSVVEIERRLEDRFALLRGGSREAPERHQTLLAVIDWSWNLLDDEERTALRRLSVFRDGFSLAGADAVIDDDALTALSSLVDQSLVTVHEGPGAVRYRLLETVREFGQVQLVDAGDDQAALRRLRDWGVGFSLRAEEDLFGPRQVQVMAEIRSEEGNLVDLLRRCLRLEDADAVIVLMACLSDFWTVEGSHLKVVALAHEVEDVVADAPVADDLVAVLRTTLAAIAFNSMIFSDALTTRALERLEQIGSGAGESRSEASTKVLLAARLGMADGDADELTRLCEHPERRVRQLALQWSSQFYENQGELDLAVELAVRSRELADGGDDADGPWVRALVSAQLAGLTVQVGEMADALRYANDALPTMEALGAVEDVAQLKAVVALAAMQEGRIDDAARIFDEIEEADAGLGVFGAAIILLCGRPELDLVAGRVEEGLRGYREAARTLATRPIPGIGLSIGYEPWVLYPEAAAVAAHVRHGRREDAVELRQDLRTKIPGPLAAEQSFIDYPVVGSVILALAEWELTGRPDEAAIQRAVRLLVCADRFGYNRQLPSLGWAAAEALAESAAPGAISRVREELRARRAADLRAEVLTLVTALD